MLQRYSKDPDVERSLRHSVRDGVSYSAMAGAGERYLSAYALFLRATTAQISWLAAFPALLGSLAQLLSAALGRRARSRKPIIVAGVLLQALTWLPIIWLPYLFPTRAVPILIVCTVLYYVFGNLAAPAWSSLMGDLVPERRRGRFFAGRTRLMSLSTFLSLVLAGILLNHFQAGAAARLGFTLVFSAAAAARLYSAYQLACMHEPARAAGADPVDLRPRPHRWAGRRSSDFARFTVTVALMNFAVAISSPFLIVYMLRDLRFSYLEYMGATAASVLVQFLTLRSWGRLTDAFGNRLVLVASGSIIPVLPLLWLVSPRFGYILCVQMLGGLSWAGFTLGAGNFLYDVAPPDRRAGYAAVHGVLSSAAVFAGALLGGILTSAIPNHLRVGGLRLSWTSGLWGVLVISALARASVAALLVSRLRDARPGRIPSPGARSLGLLRYAVFGPWPLRWRRWWRSARARRAALTFPPPAPVVSRRGIARGCHRSGGRGVTVHRLSGPPKDLGARAAGGEGRPAPPIRHLAAFIAAAPWPPPQRWRVCYVFSERPRVSGFPWQGYPSCRSTILSRP